MAAETYFGFSLDDNYEELWHELERVQDGGAGHHIAMKAATKEEAAKELASRLVEFFAKNMYSSDQQGYALEE